MPWPLDTNETLSLALTLAITVCAAGQVYFAGRLTRASDKLADLSEAMLAHQRDAVEPQVSVTPLSYSYGHLDERGNRVRKQFEGFTITNTGIADAVVWGCGLDLGVSEERNDQGCYAAFPWIRQYKGKRISTADFPHRLRSGESISVLADPDYLIPTLNGHFDGRSHRVRFQVRGNFDESCNLNAWMEWQEECTTTHGEPLPGYRPSER